LTMPLNGIRAKSVDFVICDVLTLNAVVAIEVDDRSHFPPGPQQRDAFVNAVFLDIRLQLMRVKARSAIPSMNCESYAPGPGSSPCPREWHERTHEELRNWGLSLA
jgi:Protein of unknown function (DUF2726)